MEMTPFDPKSDHIRGTPDWIQAEIPKPETGTAWVEQRI